MKTLQMRTKLLFLFCFAFVSLIITACGPSKQSITDFDIPIYQDYIEPITDPIQPQYTPASMHSKFSMVIYISITKNFKTEKKKISLEVSGTQKIEKLGKLLTWDVRVNKIVKNGKTYSPSQALLKGKMLTNKFGEVQEFEFSSPALESSNATEKEINNFIERFMEQKYMIFSGVELPSEPVQTGDPIGKTRLDQLADSIDKLDRNSLTGDDFKYIIRGWGNHNDKKVIVASIDNKMNLQTEKNISLQVRIKGYKLLDTETFQIVESKALVVMNTPNIDGSSLSAKMLIQGSNKLSKK